MSYVRTFLLMFLLSAVFHLAAAVSNLHSDTLLEEDFESGWGHWWADNGLWDIGVPTVGPDSCRSGSNCAGTDLDGNYPGLANTRLISPFITLPAINSEEYLRLRFWQWFRIYEDNYYGYDKGWVQISDDGGDTWDTVHGYISGWSEVWSPVDVDISAYAGSTIQIAFYFVSGTYSNDEGWYIDDVSVLKGPVSFRKPEDFESGFGDWSADNGLWEVGTPGVGPTTCHSGTECAGTVLNGNYTSQSGTRLISPYVSLPTIDPDERIRLRFWHWFRIYEDNYYGYDEAWVQISDDGGNQWSTLHGPISGNSEVWTQTYVDFSDYAGSTVKIAFYFTSGTHSHDQGWYIDDVTIVTGPVTFPNPEDFELGSGNWSTYNGLWEIGTPTVGPGSCPSGVQCAGTVLNGHYPGQSNARLVSPEILVPVTPNQIAGVYYWQWFNLYESYYYGDDKGWVQVSVDGGEWQSILGPFTGESGDWSQVYVDLSDYEGCMVRIAFYLSSGTYGGDVGWYIDDIEFVGIESFPYPDIKANGSDGPLILPGGNPLEVTVSLNPGDLEGQNADWWIVAVPPFNGLYWYTIANGWVRSYRPLRTYGGPLIHLPQIPILNVTSLPQGRYKLFFAVDDNMDGFPDATYVDEVTVTVQ